jgi:hypothetical protein
MTAEYSLGIWGGVCLLWGVTFAQGVERGYSCSAIHTGARKLCLAAHKHMKCNYV